MKNRIILFSIVSIALVFRLWNLADAPAWYTDEATHIEIARRLLSGEIRYFAVTDSWLLFARLPLFEGVLAAVFAVTDVSLLALRGLTVSCGIFTVILLYVILNDHDKSLALLAAMVFAVLPQAILYNRFGFSYNLLQPLMVLMLWGGWRYSYDGHRRWLALMACSVGLATITDVVGWSFVLCLIIVVLTVRLSDLLWSVPLALFPLIIYGAISLITNADAFLFDLSYTLSRTGGGSLSSQFSLLFSNLRIVMSDPVWLLAAIGLVVLPDGVLRRVILSLMLPLVILARTVPLYSLSAYYLIPFLPLLAICIASFLVNGWQYLKQQAQHNIRYLTASVVAGVILLSLSQTITMIQTDYPTAIDPFLIEPSAARDVAAFINDHATNDDIVVTSAPVGWLLDPDLQVTEFQMMAIADGSDAVHIPADLPPERLLYNMTFTDADLLIVDNLWRNWGAVHIPQVAETLATLDDAEIVFTSGAIIVYERGS